MAPKPYTLGSTCRGGHLLTKENTYIEGTRLRCEICYNIRKGLPDDKRRTKVHKLVLGGACSKGHLLTKQAVYIYPDGKMACKICRRDATRKSQGLPPADPNEPLENWVRDKNRRKTHCKSGHELTIENTRIKVDGSQECRKCTYDRNRTRQFREKYGITVEQFDEMVIQQNNCCAICGNEAADTLHVDHDHTTGAVRELLCTNCNNGLGRFFDSSELLMAAANYIIKHQQ